MTRAAVLALCIIPVAFVAGIVWGVTGSPEFTSIGAVLAAIAVRWKCRRDTGC